MKFDIQIYVVFVTVPPFWQIEPSDAAVLLNGSLTVSCEARGHPTPAIYWTKFSGRSSLIFINKLLTHDT